jgi:hypothetical protein
VFRLVVVPPLLALTGVLSIEWSYWFALGAVFLLILAQQGLVKRRAAGDELVDLIQIRRVDPPALEKLDATAGRVARENAAT